MTQSLPWEGNFPAIVTPFAEDGSIDESAFENLVGRLEEWGMSGVMIGGGNGEGWALREGERVRLVQVARRALKNRLPIVVSIDAGDPKDVIEETAQVLRAGADGIAVKPPLAVASATHKEIMARYEAILHGTDCPIMAYNNPYRTQINLSADVIAELTEHARVVAVKETARDLTRLIMLIRRVGQRATVFVAPAPFVLPGVILGARGVMSLGLLPLMGRRAVELYEAARSGDMDRARPLAYIATALDDTLRGLGTAPAPLKAAMSILGLPAGVPRAPIQPLSAEATVKLRLGLTAIGLL